MMDDVLEVLRKELDSTPRENEVIALDTLAWSEDDRRQGLAMLLDAARRGDRRAPAAFSFVASGASLEDALNEVTRGPDASWRPLRCSPAPSIGIYSRGPAITRRSRYGRLPTRR